MSPHSRVLVVEPEPLLREQILRSLAQDRLQVLGAESGAEALEILAGEQVDLILTELVLPDMTGFGLLRSVFEDSRPLWTVVLSGRASEPDRVVAFELGADDFVPKPFSLIELVARVRAILRRRGAADGLRQLVADESSRVPDAGDREVRVEGRRIATTPIESEILFELERADGRVLSREDLLTAVWGREDDRTPRCVDAHIKSLRRKLGPARRCIETVRGMGYRLSLREELELLGS